MNLQRTTLLLAIMLTLLACDSSSDTTGDMEQMDTSQQPDDTDSTPAATLVGPVDRGGMYVLEFTDGTNNWYFEAISAGGKITNYSLNGHNIIATSAVGTINGSTFWTSPQSDWSWPPPTAIDVDNYTVAVDETAGAITLTSNIDATLGVQIVKTFQVNLATKAVDVTYTIRNTGAAATQLAHWEISRVNPNGLTFYPSGVGVPTSGSSAPLAYTQEGAVTWYQHSSGMTGDGKLFADGADGWIAHTDGTAVFVKSFQDQPATSMAPGEAEIEIYAKAEYVEVEQQATYALIAPGAEAAWTVTWQLAALPATAQAVAGNEALVTFVESLL